MKTWFGLEAPEVFVRRLTLALWALCAVMVIMRGVSLDVARYALAGGGATLLYMAGIAYRASGRDLRIGATLICASLFILFTLALSLFNYLLLPHWALTLDDELARIDEVLFGYRWDAFVAWSSGHPLLHEAMRHAYMSTLPQIAVLIALLGLTGRIERMHALMVSIAIAGTATVTFWGFFPSLGPSVMFNLPADLPATAAPVVGSEYGRAILDLYRYGTTYLSPGEIRGLIAFPSFHIVLAAAAVWYARGVPWAFPIYLAINVLVVPGVLVHGGHHVVDIPAGVATFALAAYIAGLRLRYDAAKAARAAGPASPGITAMPSSPA